jgi:hypothetical protein
MNRVVACKLLADELAAYRRMPADEIRQLAREHSSRLVRGEDGVDYNLTIVVRSHSDENVRVLGFIAIADCGSPQDSLDETVLTNASR